MVHFTQYRSINLFYSVTWYISLDMWVTPFGNLRINRYLLLPAAFRSLSRPSSPHMLLGIHHKPYLLGHIIFSSSLKNLSVSLTFINLRLLLLFILPSLFPVKDPFNLLVS